MALFFAAGAAAATGSEPGTAWLEAAEHREPEAGSEPDAAPPAVDQAALDDLGDRLRRYRAVPLPQGHGWDRGVDAAYLADLVRHWADAYDWRTHEEQVRAWPWVRSHGDGLPLRAVHQRSGRPGSPALLLLHGWPDSVLRFSEGAAAADATWTSWCRPCPASRSRSRSTPPASGRGRWPPRAPR